MLQDKLHVKRASLHAYESRTNDIDGACITPYIASVELRQHCQRLLCCDLIVILMTRNAIYELKLSHECVPSHSILSPHKKWIPLQPCQSL